MRELVNACKLLAEWPKLVSSLLAMQIVNRVKIICLHDDYECCLFKKSDSVDLSALGDHLDCTMVLRAYGTIGGIPWYDKERLDRPPPFKFIDHYREIRQRLQTEIVGMLNTSLPLDRCTIRERFYVDLEIDDFPEVPRVVISYYM